MSKITDDIKEAMKGNWKLFYQKYCKGSYRSNKNGWVSTRCPFEGHDDKKPSFSFNKIHGGWKCFKDCGRGDAFDFLMEIEGYNFEQAKKELAGIAGIRLQKQIITLKQYAEHKKLPLDFLKNLGAYNTKKGIAFPYKNQEGNTVRTRFRSSLIAKEGSYWNTGKNEIIPYGLWSLNIIKQKGYVILVEGESDSHTLWFHGIPALGCPGANMFKTEWVKYFEDIPEVNIFKEPGESGERFVKNVLESFNSSSYSDNQLKVISLNNLKDPSDLFIHKPEDFKTIFNEALTQAQSIEQDNSSIPINLFPDVESFPAEVFPQPIQKLIEKGAKTINCPPDFLGVPLLSIAGTAIGTDRKLKIKSGWTETPIIFSAIVGNPGSGKSPALNHLMKPFKNKQMKFQKQYQEAKRKYEVQLSQYKQYQKNNNHSSKNQANKIKKPEKPDMKQIFTTDTTIEALAEIINKNPGGILLFKDELSSWVESMDQYRSGKGADRQYWQSLWAGSNIMINRKGNEEPLYLNEPYVGVTGAIPPDLLMDLADKKGRADGFIDRILFAYPEQKMPRWTEEILPDSILQQYNQIINELINLPSEHNNEDTKSQTIKYTSSGKKEWVEWFNSHCKEQEQADFPQYLIGPWAKLRGYCARIAIIIQELRYVCQQTNTENIEAISMNKAITLINYFKSHIKRIYAKLHTTREEEKLKDVVKWIKKHGGVVTARKIQRYKVGGVENAEEAKKLLHKLEIYNLGIVEEKSRNSIHFKLK